MLLVDWQIEDAINSKQIGIDPFNEKLIQPNSLDIRLGNTFAEYMSANDNDKEYLIDTGNPDRIAQGTVFHNVSDYIDLQPHQFMLGETLETVTLPNNIAAQIEGKSSIARLGITLHQTGGWIDAGFSGTITLEIYNANNRTVRLHTGMTIGQLVFYQTAPCRQAYNKKPDAHYMNQKGATFSKYEMKK